MKNKLLQLLLMASGSLLLIIAATPLANAQESSQATTGVVTRRTLTGEIRWKKTIGLPPSYDANQPLENICEPFYVLVLDPEREDKPVWFANVLQRGRDNAEFYSCKYEIIGVPTNKRLKVIAGMGDPFAKPYGNDKPHWYRGDWIPEGGRKPGDENKGALFPLPAGVKRQLVFSPGVKFVTLTNKDMWLSFELVFGLVRTSSF